MSQADESAYGAFPAEPQDDAPGPVSSEMLQRLAAAATSDHQLGKVYSRYGKPAPVLGRESYGPAGNDGGREPARMDGAPAGDHPSGPPGSSEQGQYRGRQAELLRQYAKDFQASNPDDADQFAKDYVDQLGEDHDALNQGMQSLFPDGIPPEYQAELDHNPDMGPEDFYRLHEQEMTGKHNTSRDDFFHAMGMEP